MNICKDVFRLMLQSEIVSSFRGELFSRISTFQNFSCSRDQYSLRVIHIREWRHFETILPERSLFAPFENVTIVESFRETAPKKKAQP